jgi:hypothetical protein
MTCNVTGVVIAPDGTLYANRKLSFIWRAEGISGFGSQALVGLQVDALTNNAGEIDVNLAPGQYLVVGPPGSVQSSRPLSAILNVPSEATAIFGQILDQTAPVTNELLQEVLEALADAEAAAAAADADAERAEVARDDAQGVLDDRQRRDVTTLLDDTDLTYTAGQPGTVTAGDIVRTRAEGFSYSVAASSATDHHVTTAGGVKLYVLRGEKGFSVSAFGAVGDGTTDDTAAIQATVDAAVAAKTSVFIPRTSLGTLGLHRITSPITVSGMVKIESDSIARGGLLCVGTSAFQIAAGVIFVTIRDMFIGQSVRHSTTPNTFKAIETLGTTGSRNFWHAYENLFIDGFEWAIDLSFTWSTTIKQVTSVFCLNGVRANGLSVNNFIINCLLGGYKAAGSFGIRIGDGTTATEGWMITDNLIANFATGIDALGAGNSHVRGNIIDFFQLDGIVLRSSASAGTINWTVDGNYLATDAAAAANGIRLKNDFSASSGQNRGHKIINNQILKYSGAALAFGISQDGTAELINIISGNSVDATSAACRIFTGNAIVTENNWKAGVFQSDVSITYANNIGTVNGTAAFSVPLGTFTPVVFGSSSAGVGTYTTQFGRYKIVDGVCHFTLRVNWTAHTGTGALRLDGLPRASVNAANYNPALTINAENLTYPAGVTSIIGFIQQGSTVIELRGSGSGTGPTAIAMDSAANLLISGSYEVA